MGAALNMQSCPSLTEAPRGWGYELPVLTRRGSFVKLAGVCSTLYTMEWRGLVLRLPLEL